jgi:hypothetical protein
MPANATFTVYYPLSIEVPEEQLVDGVLPKCEVEFNGIVYKMSCPVDTQERTIKLISGLTVPIPEGA